MLAAALLLVFLQMPAIAAPPDSDPSAANRERAEAMLARSPNDHDAQDLEVSASERIALQARAAGNPQGALEALLRAQRFAPENPRLLYDLGIMEEQIGLHQDALTTVQHLQQLTPHDPQTAYLAARVELDLGRLSDAERDMRAYLAAHPEDATAHYGLGRILQMAQQPAAAKPEFEQAITLMPAQTESYYQLGQIALDAGDFSGTLADDAKVLARDPRHGGAWTNSGIAYFRLKQYDQAASSLQQAISIAPDYQPAHYYYGLTLARLGKKPEAEHELALATQLAQENNHKDAQRLRLQP